MTATEAAQLLRAFVADHRQEALIASGVVALLALLMSWVALGRSKKLRRRLSELEETVERLEQAEERRAMKEMRAPREA